MDGIVELRHLVAPAVLGQRDPTRPQRGRRRHQEEEVQRRAGHLEGSATPAAASAADPLGPAAAAEEVHLAAAGRNFTKPRKSRTTHFFRLCTR